MLKETITSHLIRPEDLNHHGTLFAGQMAQWLLEACLIAASRLLGRPEDVVCVQLHSMIFKKPAHNGEILEIKTRIAFVGATSITVHGRVFTSKDEAPLLSGMATFVTVDKQGRPYQHGLKLPEEYIAENREIYEEALKVRGAK